MARGSDAAVLALGLTLLAAVSCPDALPPALAHVPERAPLLILLFILGLAAANLPAFRGGLRPWLIHQLVEYRAVVLVCFACPMSVLVWLLNTARNRYTEAFARPEDHERRVEAVAAQVRAWAASPPSGRRPMCTARASWQNLSTRFVNKDVLHKIELSQLRDVLSIDAAPGEKGTVLVEPSVTVGYICRKLAPTHMLAVCLELEDATLGGLAMGVGMTTASHIYGLYQETIVSMKVVVGDGTVVHATRTNEHAALFKCLPWSHGSLGFLVELELMVVPTQPHVRLTYTPTFSQEECCALVRELSNAEPPPDFVEATVFDRERAVVMAGVFEEADSPEKRALINPISRWYKPWWYTHVQDICEGGEEVVEYVPLRHYILRHNRAIFWTLQDMIPPWFGNHPLFRFLFGWMVPPAVSFLKYTTTAEFRNMTFSKQVFQDIVLPMTELEEALQLADQLFGVLPVLIYPCRVFDYGPEGNGQMRSPKPEQMVRHDSGMFFDLGAKNASF
jgi:delta24-sterol reductase